MVSRCNTAVLPVRNYTRCISPKRVTNLWGLYSRFCACRKHNSFRRVIELNLRIPRFEPRPQTYRFRDANVTAR